MPWINAAQELKTKPTQHSVKELLGIGIQADVLLCRSERVISPEMKGKIAAFCNVEERAVIGAIDVPSIYECPLGFAKEGVDELILKYLRIDAPAADLTRWRELVDRCYNPQDHVSIAIVGKYVGVRGQLQVAQGSFDPRGDRPQPETRRNLDRG